MPDPNLFRLNATPYSGISCTHLFMGLPYRGVLETDYEESRTTELIHQTQRDGVPLGQNAGLYKVESVTFTLLRESANMLLLDLAAIGLGSYGDAVFDYVLTVTEPTALQVPPAVPLVVTIAGCRIQSVKEKQAVEDAKLTTEIKAKPIRITRVVGGVPITLYSFARQMVG